MINQGQQQFIDSQSNFVIAQCPAGSGKTFAMVEKIANLYDQRIHPRNVLAFTFTRAAGVNLRERSISRIGEEVKEMFANTIHAFAIKVISENTRHVNGMWYDLSIADGSLDYTIYNQDDRADICKALIKKLNVKVTVADVAKMIYGEFEKDGKAFADTNLIATAYRDFCIENVALDLDDLINTATKLLQIDEVRANYNYEYVFVDEFQDTNDTQIALIKALNPRRLYVIGDANQSIYGFNRAKIEYILNFHKDWPEVETITFTENYRSTQILVDRATEIIKKNTQGTVIDVKAQKDGPDVLLHIADDFDSECEFVYRQIISKESKYKDHAILCRTNALVSQAADYLKMKSIPVKVMSSADDPFKVDYVKSYIKFLQFCMNPLDQYAFRQFINYPVKRMDSSEIDSCIRQSAINELPIHKTKGFPHKLVDIVDKIKSMKDNEADKVFTTGLIELGVVKEYSYKGFINRLITFDECSNVISRWAKKSQHRSISAFVKWLIIKDIQEKMTEEKDAVVLTTIHGAKGLEWPHVYCMGVTEGIFPNQKVSSDIEEERRLMYVALTRAEETATVTCANYYRTAYGQIFNAGPSEFYQILENNYQ